MKIKDKIGESLTNFMYPYIQKHIQERGDNVLKLETENSYYSLQEKYLWFLGNEELLADFYATRTQSSLTVDTKASYYYSNLDSKIRIVHSGLPSLCSYAKANLLLSGGLEYNVMNGENEMEKETQTLTDILDDNNYKTLLKSMAVIESWAGKFALKLSIDKKISKYPIIELYSPLSYKSVYVRGRLFEIIFIEKYQDGKYELHQHYGKGYIKYELYKVGGGKLTKAPLTEIAETADLKDETLKNNVMWAMEKCVTKSDYQGIIAEFDAIDETWSQLLDEIRTGRAETYVPDMLMDNKQFNDFRKKYVVTGNDDRESGKNEITHNQPNIRTEEYTKSLIALRDNILANFGLSPITIGIGDTVGANASGDSLEKREIVSLRTRSQMIETWEDFLDELFMLLLIVNKNSLFTGNVSVKTMFGDYITPSKSELIEQTKQMVDASIIDQEKALDEIYGDEITEEEKIRILANVGAMTETPEQPDEEDNEDEMDSE